MSNKKKKSAKIINFINSSKRNNKIQTEDSEIKRMDNLGMKGSGQHTLSPDEKSELSRLRSKYSDLVKRRAEKTRSRGPR